MTFAKKKWNEKSVECLDGIKRAIFCVFDWACSSVSYKRVDIRNVFHSCREIRLNKAKKWRYTRDKSLESLPGRRLLVLDGFGCSIVSRVSSKTEAAAALRKRNQTKNERRRKKLDSFCRAHTQFCSVAPFSWWLKVFETTSILLNARPREEEIFEISETKLFGWIVRRRKNI